jgi:hypothetical protein
MKRETVGIVGAVLLVLGLFALLGLRWWLDAHKEPEPIPTPPPGYVYCVQGDALAFCRS